MASVVFSRMRGRALNPNAVFAAFALLPFAAILGSEAHAAETSFKDFPFLIQCEYKGTSHAYYLSRLGVDGIAIYITPDRQAGTISIGGTAEAVGDERSGTCAGKTLDRLRSAGQAFDLGR